MRLICDENFPLAAVGGLRAAGHDVVHVSGGMCGMPDEDVLAFAQRERRVLATFDKDFGKLANEIALAAEVGVILFRIPMIPAATLSARILSAVAGSAGWEGKFSVVEPGRVRTRRDR
jgi:predicted nuclease of predicted toxin-antitoxin system